MYNLKELPEDFIVQEFPQRNFSEEGKYLVCLLKKKNYNTEDAVQAICKALGTVRRNISYAGNKDRKAVTHQYISLYMGSKERIENLDLKDIFLKPIGRINSPISLGDLKGNKFTIIVRNLEKDVSPKNIDKFPNYYDEQRFSKNNVRIGRAIIKKDFKSAADIIANEDYKYGNLVKTVLEKEPHNFIGSLQELPSKILLIYVHSYQSYLWNLEAEKYLEKNPDSEQRDLPLVGFYEPEDEESRQITDSILKEENLVYRDFIVREIPSISMEGSTRKLFCNIFDLEFGKLEDDELNPGKKKLLVKFFLEKGSYATMAIKYLFNLKN